MTTAALDGSALAHRALVTAMLYGLGPPARTSAIAWAPPSELATVRAADVIVTVDGPELDVEAFTAAREAASPDGVVTVVVASKAALGLVSAASPAQNAEDAYARARAWGALAANGPRAPAVAPARLRDLAAAASGAGLVLVEPEVPRVRVQPRHAVDRAILATIALGGTARPLLFVREGRAPRGGLARLRDERILDGWIEGRGLRASAPSLLGAALDTLAEAGVPVAGKQLLREARMRWTEAARAAGIRATSSAGDVGLLAKALRVLWLDGAIEVYARDPVAPLVAT